MSPEEPFTAGDLLPPFKRNWPAIKEQFPRGFAPGNWKEKIDAIVICWRDTAPEIPDRIVQFETSLQLPHIPELEKQDAREYLANTRQAYQEIVAGIFRITRHDELKWSEMKTLAALSENMNNGSPEDDQAMALLQAISETHAEGRTPEQIRQLIAQQVFDEIFRTGEYRVLEYTVVDFGDELANRSTQDPLLEEKDELIHTLQRPVWDAQAREERKKIYRAWRQVIRNGDNFVDESVADQIEKLWNATKGEGVSRESALHLLQLGEDIYQGMEEGGAFDIDLNDVELEDEE